MIKFLIIIPFYNEYDSLKKLSTELIKYKANCLFIDDGSKDNGSKLLKEFNLIKNTINVGYHKTLAKGLKYARKNNYDFSITFDADGQHKVRDLDKIISILKSNKYDFISTKRNKNNRLIEYFINAYFYSKFNRKDILSGLKAYRLSKIDMKSNFFIEDSVGIGFSMLYLSKKYNFYEFDIQVSERIGKSTFGGLFKGNLKLFKSFFKIVIKI